MQEEIEKLNNAEWKYTTEENRRIKTKITMTKEIAISLKRRDTIYLYDQFDSNRTPTKCRVNGKCKTWKREPNRFSLPVKRGLYEYGYITENNMDIFYIEV